LLHFAINRDIHHSDDTIAVLFLASHDAEVVVGGFRSVVRRGIVGIDRHKDQRHRHVRLSGGVQPFQFDDLLRAGNGIDDPAQNIPARVLVDVGAVLSEWGQNGPPLEAVEQENTSRGRQPDARRD
jgi:hypothetical protein